MTTTTERYVDPETGEILDELTVRLEAVGPDGKTVSSTTDMSGLRRAADQAKARSQRWDLLPPDDEVFDESESGFVLSEPLAELGAELIERHHRRFYYIEAMDLTIAYCWKRNGGVSNGKAVFGKCQKTSGALNLFSESNWIIWLAADHVREAGYGAEEVENILLHELLHTGYDAKKGCIVKGHDFNGFLYEIEQIGLWHNDLASAGRTMRDSGAIDKLPATDSVMRNQVVRG